MVNSRGVVKPSFILHFQFWMPRGIDSASRSADLRGTGSSREVFFESVSQDPQILNVMSLSRRCVTILEPLQTRNSANQSKVHLLPAFHIELYDNIEAKRSPDTRLAWAWACLCTARTRVRQHRSRPCVGAPHHRSVVAAAAAGEKGVEGARGGRERGARERVRVGREAGGGYVRTAREG